MQITHPEPEVLAAWIDQKLVAAKRRQTDAHLASCEDCRVLLAHVIETQMTLAELHDAIKV